MLLTILDIVKVSRHNNNNILLKMNLIFPFKKNITF